VHVLVFYPLLNGKMHGETMKLLERFKHKIINNSVKRAENCRSLADLKAFMYR